MNFHKLFETPRPTVDVFFRESRLKQALILLIFLAISATAAVIGYQGGIDHDGVSLPSGLAYWIAGVMALMSLVVVSGFRASLRGTNWLMRYDGARLLIKYRSYLNHHLPEGDFVVVEINLSEIEWIRAFKEKRIVPSMGGDGPRTEAWTYLDLCLNHKDTAKLLEYLRQERLRGPGKTLWSAFPPTGKRRQVIKSRYLHYPVRLVEDNLIRIDWKSHRTSITPKIDKALKILGDRLRILEQERDVKVNDFTSLESLDAEQQEQMIRQLAESGDTLATAKVVRDLYGYSTTEAVKYVRKLPGGESAGVDHHVDT